MSKPTSVDELLNKEFACSWCNKYSQLHQADFDEFKAKINRLIVESQITAIRVLKAERHESDGICNSGFYIDAEDRDKLLAELNKEPGDSNE